jgi:hypothetical protein
MDIWEGIKYIVGMSPMATQRQIDHAHNEGMTAFHSNHHPHINPYPHRSAQAHAWLSGFYGAMAQRSVHHRRVRRRRARK